MHDSLSTLISVNQKACSTCPRFPSMQHTYAFSFMKKTRKLLPALSCVSRGHVQFLTFSCDATHTLLSLRKKTMYKPLPALVFVIMPGAEQPVAPALFILHGIIIAVLPRFQPPF